MDRLPEAIEAFPNMLVHLDLPLSLPEVSASTLSRIENSTGTPDAPTLARLAKWLNVPLERIVGAPHGQVGEPVVYYPQESTPDIVEAHLRADRNLTPETARALAELFRVAYQQFSAPGQDMKARKGRK